MRNFGYNGDENQLLVGSEYVDPETGLVYGTECKPWQFFCRAKAQTKKTKEMEKQAAAISYDFDYGESVIKPYHWALMGVAGLVVVVSLFMDRRK